MAQHNVVLKLAHHFHRDSRFASKTLGIKTIKELLILLTQSEHMFRTEYRNKTNFILREESCAEKNTPDPPDAGKGREVRDRETKRYSNFNSTDSLKYLERGKQVEISRQQKCEMQDNRTMIIFLRRTIVMQEVYRLL